jgi:hypothetical protein
LELFCRNEGDNKWKEFFFEGKYGYEKRAFIPLSQPTHPFKGGPLYSPEVPSARIHPIAIGTNAHAHAKSLAFDMECGGRLHRYMQVLLASDVRPLHPSQHAAHQGAR